MSRFKEDDQAGSCFMQAFWKSPIGQKWIKESKEAQDRLPEEGSAEAVMLDCDTINLKRFEDE